MKKNSEKIVISISRTVIKNGAQRSKAKFSGNILRNISHDNFNSKSTYQCLQLVESMKQQKKSEILSKAYPHQYMNIWNKHWDQNKGKQCQSWLSDKPKFNSVISYGKFWNSIGPGIQHEVLVVMGNHHKHKRFSKEDH